MAAPVTPCRIEALGKTHDRSRFACGVEALDRYLKQQARQDADRRVAAVFVLVAPPAPQVLGYFTLSASVITADELPPELTKRVPRYPQLPVVLLGRLAVDHPIKGRKQGEFLLMDALRRSLEAATQIGARAVLVEAKNEATEAFYQHFGFMPLKTQPARLFLSMKTVAELFETMPPTLSSRPDPLTVACLCAGWCVACQGYVAVFAQVAQAHPDAHFVWIDIEDHSDALGDEALDIENFPTVMVLQGRDARFFGTVLPHAATLVRLVQAAQVGSLAEAAVKPAMAMAAAVADLAATLQGVATAAP